MFKRPGESKRIRHCFPKRKIEGTVKVDPRLRDKPSIQRWTAGEQGLERFETKELRELDTQRAIQDVVLEERHKQFDISAKDNHMKYERQSFAVVTSSEAYRLGWERMFGKEKDDGMVPGLSTGSDRPPTESER